MAEQAGTTRSEGRRIFISDFHPRDMTGWPRTSLEAILVCSRTLEHEIKVWDSALLPAAVQPDILFQPPTKHQEKLSLDRDRPVPLFATTGKVPHFFGQPIAIAFYADYETSFFASQYLRELSHFEVNYRSNPELARRFSLDDDLEAWKLFQFPKEAASHVSFLKGSVTFPAVNANRPSLRPRKRNGEPGLVFDDKESINSLAWTTLNEVRDALKGETYVHKTSTPLGDNAFLEPEAGLAWYDKTNKTLHLRLGSQNIYTDAKNAATAVDDYFNRDVETPLGNFTVNASNHDMGGGFGGRNGSLFANYLAIAAVHAALHSESSVRLSWDRFQQFVLGLKRHASAVESTFKVNRETNLFEALESFMVLGDGVQLPVSSSILGLGTAHLTGPYQIPLTALHGVVSSRPHAPCGPSRGFGIPQACVHIETLVERVAHDLNIDPIRLRTLNAFTQGKRDPSGYPLAFHVANCEVLARAAAHPVWQQREQRKKELGAQGVRYGVGFAASMEAYGASSDPVFGAVELRSNGRLTVHSDMAEMGQGCRTAISLTINKMLGVAPEPDEITLCDPSFFGKTFPKQEGRSTASASKTAFVHLHAIREACDILLKEGFLEAARLLLSLNELPEHYHWQDGALLVDGAKPLTRSALLDKMEEEGLCTGVNCHALFKNGWARADKIDGVLSKHPRFVDALAVQRGFISTWHNKKIEESLDVKPPPNLQRSLYAASGHLIEVAIEPASGRLTVLSCHSILDAGDVISLPIVEGQAEGGFAMGLGFALSEQIPEDPRKADFMNFHTYRAPRFRALAPIRHTLEFIPLPDGHGILPETGPKSRSKGIAESVMTTVAPALANAIAHASGNYDWLNGLQLPITRQAIRIALKESA